MARNIPWHAEKRSPGSIQRRFWDFGAQLNDEGNVEIYRGYKENSSITGDENKCLVLHQADSINNPEVFELVNEGSGDFILGRSVLGAPYDWRVSANGAFESSSSGALKENFKNMSDTKALKVIQELEPKSYVYKKNGEKGFGTTAENFRDATGFGDGATINALSAAGIALRLIQYVFKRVEALEKQLTALNSGA